jgi:hypothetical protein
VADQADIILLDQQIMVPLADLVVVVVAMLPRVLQEQELLAKVTQVEQVLLLAQRAAGVVVVLPQLEAMVAAALVAQAALDYHLRILEQALLMQAVVVVEPDTRAVRVLTPAQAEQVGAEQAAIIPMEQAA